MFEMPLRPWLGMSQDEFRVNLDKSGLNREIVK